MGFFCPLENRHDGPRFLWVYDCGTSSSQKLIRSGVDELREWMDPHLRIDLLFLSHFDHDHISGVCRLIQNFKIGTLVLPFMSLAQRLLVAFEERAVVGDALTTFATNPVAFLMAQDGPGIERILFVGPSGGQGTEPPPVPEIEPPNLDKEGIEFLMDYRLEKMPYEPNETDPLFAAADSGASNMKVEFLAPGSSIQISRIWEFIPYNDALDINLSENFESMVHDLKDQLLESDDSARKEALNNLKEYYDSEFGRTSKWRNLISLFLYSGPIYSVWKIFDCEVRSSSFYRDRSFYRHMEVSSQNCSILYSGDGYLDTHERLKRLIDYLRPERIPRIGFFQVMHHGAEFNWHRGVAEALNPRCSIFCSDPDRKDWGHPHAPVLRDFWTHGPVQVDRENSITFEGVLG